MAFTCGFFNSQNGDRKYNAEQMASIFDGLIKDGVYDTVGDIFAVTPGTGMQVLVGSGRAWFDHTWNNNDAQYPLAITAADVSLPRYDAVVLETNHSDTVRTNRLRVLTGTPASNPVKPTMTSTANVKQHPLAYIKVTAGATAITQSMIQVVVGTSECPFVTGIIDTAQIDALFQQWNGEFNEWFDNLKAQLSDNVVANLQGQIDKKVAKADVATKADIEAGTSTTKWVSPKGLRESGIDSSPKSLTTDDGKKISVTELRGIFYANPYDPNCNKINVSGPTSDNIVSAFKYNGDVYIAHLFTIKSSDHPIYLEYSTLNNLLNGGSFTRSSTGVNLYNSSNNVLKGLGFYPGLNKYPIISDVNNCKIIVAEIYNGDTIYKAFNIATGNWIGNGMPIDAITENYIVSVKSSSSQYHINFRDISTDSGYSYTIQNCNDSSQIIGCHGDRLFILRGYNGISYLTYIDLKPYNTTQQDISSQAFNRYKTGLLGYDNTYIYLYCGINQSQKSKVLRLNKINLSNNISDVINAPILSFTINENFKVFYAKDDLVYCLNRSSETDACFNKNTLDLFAYSSVKPNSYMITSSYPIIFESYPDVIYTISNNSTQYKGPYYIYDTNKNIYGYNVNTSLNISSVDGHFLNESKGVFTGNVPLSEFKYNCFYGDYLYDRKCSILFGFKEES